MEIERRDRALVLHEGGQVEGFSARARAEIEDAFAGHWGDEAGDELGRLVLEPDQSAFIGRRLPEGGAGGGEAQAVGGKGGRLGRNALRRQRGDRLFPRRLEGIDPQAPEGRWHCRRRRSRPFPPGRTGRSTA